METDTPSSLATRAAPVRPPIAEVPIARRATAASRRTSWPRCARPFAPPPRPASSRTPRSVRPVRVARHRRGTRRRALGTPARLHRVVPLPRRASASHASISGRTRLADRGAGRGLRARFDEAEPGRGRSGGRVGRTEPELPLPYPVLGRTEYRVSDGSSRKVASPQQRERLGSRSRGEFREPLTDAGYRVLNYPVLQWQSSLTPPSSSLPPATHQVHARASPADPTDRRAAPAASAP